jgi:hypothetical protein
MKPIEKFRNTNAGYHIVFFHSFHHTNCHGSTTTSSQQKTNHDAKHQPTPKPRKVFGDGSKNNSTDTLFVNETIACNI